MRRTSRMTPVGLAGLCCGLGLMATSFLAAQQPAAETTTRQRAQTQSQTGEKHFCLATELIGMNAKAKGEEEVGQIQNLIINAEGDVQYLAISSGSQSPATERSATERSATDRLQQQQERQSPARVEAGAAGQLTLVPWELAKFHAAPSKTQSYVSLEIEKDRLMSAPSFSQQQLTAQASQSQVTMQVDQFFNVQRRGAARPELDRGRTPQNEQNRQPQQNDN